MSGCKKKQNLEFLTIQNLTLRQISIDMSALKGKDLLKNYWRFLFVISCVIYLQFCLISFVIYSGVMNMDKASTSLVIFNQGCLILIKLAIFLVKRNKFRELIWDMNQLAENATTQEKKKWLSENMRSQKMAKTYFYACCITVAFSIIFPLIFMAYDYNQNNSFRLILPYGGRFPYYKDGIFLFIVNYILSLIYIYGLLNMTVGFDTLYCWYIYGISAHFRILRCKVQSAGLKLQSGNCANFTQKIGLIVTYHNRIFGFVKDLNAIFGEVLWAEVMLSCLQICFSLYSLRNSDNVYSTPFNFMTLVSVIIQLVIYCFGGEKIKNESLMLSLDFYLSFPWHSMSPKEKKLMLLPLMRSQRLSSLRGVFFEVDRNLLIYIFKTAFSFNTLLSAMKE